MTIEKIVTAYEFLVRWAPNGTIPGAHIKMLERILDNGVVISEKEGAAMPVSMAGEVGFPLADILNLIQSTALTTAESATAQAAKITTDADTAIAAEKAAHDATKVQLADALAKIPAPNVDANGVPTSVTMRQARLALLGAGMLDGVQAAIDAMTGQTKKAALIEWDYSNDIVRTNGLVDRLAPALGLTSAQIDALFITASKL